MRLMIADANLIYFLEWILGWRRLLRAPFLPDDRLECQVVYTLPEVGSLSWTVGRSVS